MSKRNPVGECRTCGKSFRRSRPRQAKCVQCWAFNLFRCARCGELYQRVDAVKLCVACLRSITPPASERAEDWNRFLSLTGQPISRGSNIGAERIAYEHELTPENPQSGHDSPLEQIADGTDIEAALDNKKLLTWFLSAPAREVGRTLGLHHEAVARLRSEYFDIPRDELRTAMAVLGFPEAQWRRQRLGVAIIRARTEWERVRLSETKSSSPLSLP